MNEFLSVSKSLEIQELSKDMEIDQPEVDLIHPTKIKNLLQKNFIMLTIMI